MKRILSRKLLLLVFLLGIILQGSFVIAASPTSDTVQVTLYMHEGSTSGPVLAGMLISGHDSNGVQFSKITDSSGSVSLSGAPGDWQFSASKDGYDSRSWGNYIVISKNLNGFLTKTPVVVSTTKNPVQVTLYMHEGSTSGPVLAGMLISGQDGNGVRFSKTTDSSGSVSLSGAPGDWQFSASKDGYDSRSWGNYIVISKSLNGFLTKTRVVELPTTPSPVQLTLCVHDTTSSGPVLSGVKITGKDGAGTYFEAVTDSTGTAVISGSPGIWSYAGSKDGYVPLSWGNNAYTTRRHDAYLQKSSVGADQTTTPDSPVQLTLCVHDTTSSGPVLSGVKIIGKDGAGTYFEAVTDSTGTAVISGSPGIWSYAGSKDGYVPLSWGNNAYTTRRHDAYLQKSSVAAPQQATSTGNVVQVILYMHDRSTTGTALSDVTISGSDGNGITFSKSTDRSGAVIISGSPGIWQFSSSKTGYASRSWQNTISSSQQLNGYLIASSEGVAQPPVSNPVTVTLIIHDGSASGSPLTSVLINGQDGSGASFSQTTDASGTVTLSGASGTWQFLASKTGYDSRSWSNDITLTKILDGYIAITTPVQNDQPKLITDKVTAVSGTQATLNGHIENAKAGVIYSVCFRYDKDSSKSTTMKNEVMQSNPSFSYTMTDLNPGAAYSYRAVSSNSPDSIDAENVESFITVSASGTASCTIISGRPTIDWSDNGWFYPLRSPDGKELLKKETITNAEFDSPNPTVGNLRHLGYDLLVDGRAIDCPELKYSVYAIGDGTVEEVSHHDHWGGDDLAPDKKPNIIVIKHTAADGTIFYALYGHLQNIPTDLKTVTKGQFIGNTLKVNEEHLHFSLDDGSASAATQRYRGYTDSTDTRAADYGFYDPVAFLKNHSPNVEISSHQSTKDQFNNPASESKSKNWIMDFFSNLLSQQSVEASTDLGTKTSVPSTPSLQTPSPSKVSNTASRLSSVTYSDPPGEPHPLSPGQQYEPGEKIYTRTPTFTWDAGTQAEYYSLAISKSPYGSDNIVYSLQKISGTSSTIPDNILVVGEKYRWNMYAYNSAGKSKVSWTLYFNVKP